MDGGAEMVEAGEGEAAGEGGSGGTETLRARARPSRRLCRRSRKLAGARVRAWAWDGRGKRMMSISGARVV